MTATNYTYNPKKRHLILLSVTGRPIISIAGPVGQRMYDRINQLNRTPMEMTQKELERKVSSLNDWLMDNANHRDYKLKKQNRDYYVNKLIELTERKLKNIKV